MINMKTLFVLIALGVVTNAAGFDNRIVGGKEAYEGQFPYQGSLRIFSNHYCGVSILNEYWLLTAAHCIQGYEDYPKKVVLGTNSRFTGGDSYNVIKAIFHEKYENKLYDDGLVKVNGSIKFTPKVQPIKLQTEDIGSGEEVILSGWGKLGAEKPPADRLQYIRLKTITNDDCGTKLNKTIIDNQICTYTKKGEGGCMGDSGGPLAYKGKVAGIVSYGIPCGVGYPDVFTRVSKVITWIEEIMAKN